MLENNYAFIAENVVTIYSSLAETSFGKKLTEEQLYYATSLIDLMAYIMEGQITVTEIQTGVLTAMCREVSVGFYGDTIYDSLDFKSQNQKLVCLAMQIEAMIFCAENTMFNYKLVVDSVLQNKKLIEKTVNKTYYNPRKSRIYNTVRANVFSIVKDKAFQNEVISFTA